jgi:hypothetical protein
MAHLDDLAMLILHHREVAARLFDSELEKLKHTYGAGVIARALELASRQGAQRASISVSDAKARHQAEQAAARRTQAAFRKQHGDGAAAVSLPPAWRERGPGYGTK